MRLSSAASSGERPEGPAPEPVPDPPALDLCERPDRDSRGGADPDSLERRDPDRRGGRASDPPAGPPLRRVPRCLSRRFG